jgi:hypothetical protein
LCRRSVGYCLRGYLFIAWRGASYPGAAVKVVPLSGFAVFRPPPPFRILHHGLLEFVSEVLSAKIAVVVSPLEVGIATVCLSKIDLRLLSSH